MADTVTPTPGVITQAAIERLRQTRPDLAAQLEQDLRDEKKRAEAQRRLEVEAGVMPVPTVTSQPPNESEIQRRREVSAGVMPKPKKEPSASATVAARTRIKAKQGTKTDIIEPPKTIQQLSGSAQQTALLPPGSKFAEYSGINIPDRSKLSSKAGNFIKAIYQSFTPWSEEKGETIGSYVTVSIPKHYTNPDTPSQAELKKQYDAEHDSPLWSRLLFGDSVYKTKDGAYTSTSVGVMPLVSGGAPGGGISLKAVKDIPKVTNAINKSGVTKQWKNVLAAFESGAIEDSPSMIKWVGQNIKNAQIVNDVKYSGYVARTAADVLADKIDDFKAWERVYLAAQKAVPATSQAAPIRVFGIPIMPGFSAKTIQAISERVDNFPAEVVFKELTQADMIVPVTITNPEVISKAAEELDQEKRSQIFADIITKIKQAKLQKLITDTQADDAQSIVEKVSDQADENTQTSGKTQPLTKTNVKTTTSTAVQTKTATKPKTQTDQKTETAVQPATETAVPGPADGQGKGRTTTTPSRLKPGYTTKEDRRKRAVIKNADGAIAWRQGKVGKKDVWHVILSPYTRQENILTVVGGSPKGADLARGPKSAYRTAQTLYGHRISRPVTIDVGIVDARLSPVGGKKAVKLSFKPDPKLQTKSDLTISKGRKFPLK